MSRSGASGPAGRIDDADVRGNDLPTLREAHPGLHLAAHFLARHDVAMKKRGGDRIVAAVGGYHRTGARAHEVDRRAPGTKRRHFLVAVKVLGDAVADGALVLAEQGVERIDVVAHQRLLVALEGLAHLGNDLGQVDVHGFPPYSAGCGAATALLSSSACAIRSAMSSRHGAAMICTPIGSGASGTGTATTGSPMNEVGWVKMPMLGRNGTSAPLSVMVCWPMRGAGNGVAGATMASTPSN